MLKKINFSLIALILITILGFNTNCTDDKNPINIKKGKDYKALWAKIDSLQDLSLPKSALKIVDKIYTEAKADNNTNQIVKAFIYKLKFSSQTTEDGFSSNLLDLQQEITKSKFPTTNILHSILAQMYWNYYQNNKWRIISRSETINFENNDIKTWTSKALINKSIKEFNLSLQNSDSLQRTSILFFDDILIKGENTENLQPTLYDFLANTAFTFFKNPQITLTSPSDKFELLDNKYFSDANTFANFKIETSDTMSLQFYGIKIWQNLTNFRKNDSNIDALIDLELNRLDFVYLNSVNPNKDELYETALTSLLKTYSYTSKSSDISYRLAKYYRNKSTKYLYTDSLTYQYKSYNKKAIDLCNNAIKNFPKSIYSLECDNLAESIKSRTLSIQIEDVIPSNENFSVRLSYLNINTIYYKIGKISPATYKKLKSKLYGKKLYKALLKACDYIQKGNFTLPNDNDYNKHSTEYVLKGLDYGFYILFASNNNEFSANNNLTAINPIVISDISYARKSKKNGQIDFYVCNRKNGEALQNVKVDFFKETYNYKKRKYENIKISTKYSNKDGYIFIKNNDLYKYDISAIFTNGKDVLEPNTSFYSYKTNPPTETVNDYIFTDRAIYRPGQTIYFKGIKIKSLSNKRTIIPNSNVIITFYDVNYQKISSLTLKTNEYGTFNGSFKIPMGLLNGRMQITTPNGSKFINVEEYKRPKFETKILPFNKSYRLNEDIEIKGLAKSYSGANLTNATVNYTINRKTYSRYYWRYNFNENQTLIKNGTTTTDENGEYKINFKALPDLKLGKNAYFNYSINVDVTDINGETQSTSSNIYIGYVDLKVSTNLSSLIEKNDNDTFKIYSHNLNGEEIDSKGTISIYELQTPDKAYRESYWPDVDKKYYSQNTWQKIYPNNEYNKINDNNLKNGKLVYSENYDTKDKKYFVIKNKNKWNPNKYRVIIKSKDAFGSNVENQNNFTLYDKNSKKLTFASNMLFIPVKVSGEPGDTAEFIIGSSHNAKVLYQISSNNNPTQTIKLNLNNNQKLIKIPITESHRGNFAINGFFIFNNRKYSFSTYVYVPFTNKDLKIEFQTFRDKLLPGQKEKWLITIKDKNGDPAMAEMLATMYDKSLDAFAPNYFGLNIYPYFYNSSYWTFDLFNTDYSQLFYFNNDYSTYPTITYNSLNWFNFYNYRYNYYSMDDDYSGAEKPGQRFYKKEDERTLKSARDEIMTKDVASDIPSSAPMSIRSGEAKDKISNEETIATESQDDEATGKNNQGLIGGSSQSIGLGEVKARTNFNETAFFYPNLVTNKKGELVIEFTIPESLTKWKMLGLATTKDLKIGTISKELITQKELMVAPNPPRFFREGDKMEFPLKISNISDKDLNIDYDIEFFDAISNKKISITDNFKKEPIKIKKGGNKLISVSISIPDDIDAIKYRVVAKSGNYSDAEENVIPVLNNRMLVTESLPLPINGNQTKTFVFTKLKENKSKTLKNYKYTLEFTSNPAWYAVQSLPYLMEYPYECAEQTFSRFYANSLASHIANSSPKIKAVFESWKNTKDSKALLSNLEKNQELKALMLEETPWVLDGKNESERKSRIALLFDLNKMSNELSKALQKLQKMQSSNGGWPWFENMPEDRYITQYIVTGMGHLDHLNVKEIRKDRKTWSMIVKATNYLDNRIYDDYTWIKDITQKKKWKKCLLEAPKFNIYTHVAFLKT